MEGGGGEEAQGRPCSDVINTLNGMRRMCILAFNILYPFLPCVCRSETGGGGEGQRERRRRRRRREKREEQEELEGRGKQRRRERRRRRRRRGQGHPCLDAISSSNERRDIVAISIPGEHSSMPMYVLLPKCCFFIWRMHPIAHGLNDAMSRSQFLSLLWVRVQ